ncbi:hypothetical protein EMIHUDRAFT_462683 [Emiliania huxleyi CCMP1516]|uniref:Methyltransferase type 11 domain-containing protein n=2 Tax=Emiliania huxleyi TaxID=2903 RepID=A0A0D3K8C2_EMIH1|nr:hypothetical protein EMIHUDRAFT_462683 [Emiliania huxleyi CCMP1516]EOD32007.1 hypothetical protein EMIHUDRAFT_462683 [Emiliania huxleyi CCMP1516]|eukprot:XP_005784436.1 hypothetical protein EMIHUDRAFT_462683 [Emiliania huxleyi CCMP1516]
MLPLSLLNLAVSPGSRSLADRRCFCAAAAAAVIATPPQAVAASPTTAAIYDAEASAYDAAYANSLVSRAVGFDSLRRSVATRAHGDHAGDVLELGVGTGLNLPFYEPASVRTLTGIDASSGASPPSLARTARSAERAACSSWRGEEPAICRSGKPPPEPLCREPRVTLRIADAAALPFPDSSFDAVVDTFGLCVFEAPGAVLSEVRRVLRPGGEVVLLEHDDGPVSRALAFTRGTSAVAATCAYDQDVAALVTAAGLRLSESEPVAGGFLRRVVAGRALER